MSTIADYPDGVATAGPFINRLIDQPITYEFDIFEYEDGGADVNVNPCGMRRIVLEYEGLTAAEVLTLRAHYDLAKSRVNNFEFYHRRDAVTYAGVEYEKFEVGRHVKAWSNPLSVALLYLAGANCPLAWTFPTVAAFPLPAAGGPQHAYFDETAGDWGEFGHNFADGKPRYNTIQSAPVRRFLCEWQGLSAANAAALDAHFHSTRGALSFTVTHPRTGEVITSVRYQSYERSPHKVYWAQDRRAQLVRYTG